LGAAPVGRGGLAIHFEVLPLLSPGAKPKLLIIIFWLHENELKLG